MCLGVPFISLIPLPGPCCAYRQRFTGPDPRFAQNGVSAVFAIAYLLTTRN
jgi:hypothetical protein